MSLHEARRHISENVRALLRDPQLHELLRWCAPALLLAVALRVLLTIQMPFGYVQFDTADFLVTAQRFITKGDLVIHGKKSFLVPVLYTVPFVLHIPALIVIPLAQHVLGVLVVLMTGALVRLWFARWKWLIIPTTVIIAADPVLLWFEHALMAESIYLFWIVALALAGTLFALRKSTGAFVFLLVALFFTAGSRPEGKLFFAFGFLLIPLVCWANWKTVLRRMAWLCGLALVSFAINRSDQAGQLLYATVLQLTPDQSKVEPAFGDWIRPLREKRQAELRQGGAEVDTELTSLEKAVTDTARAYLKSQGRPEKDSNALCQKLAIEACLSNPIALPALAAKKFLLATKHAVSVGFTEETLYAKQRAAFTRKGWLLKLTKGLTGQRLSDDEQVRQFVLAHYQPLAWYSWLHQRWLHFTLKLRPRTPESPGQNIPRLPYFFAIALIGMAAALARPGPMRPLHLAFIMTLAGVGLAIVLTGVVNPRYRYIFEPFCVVYAMLAVDVLISTATMAVRAVRRDPAQRTSTSRSATALENARI